MPFVAVALRLAVRQLVRRPAISAFVVLSIALGLAASATALSLAWTVTGRPLPFPAADRLVRVWLASEENPRIELSIPDLGDLERAVTGFERFSGTARTRFLARLGDGTVRMRGEAIGPSYFDMMGIRPALGRLFSNEDHRPDAPRQVVVSTAVWRQHFGARPDVIGAELRTERATFEVIGVVASDFAGTIEADVVEFWIPLAQYLPIEVTTSRTDRLSWAVARLAPGVAASAIVPQLERLTSRLQREHPTVYRGLALRVEPFAANWRGEVRGSALLLFGAAITLLAIAVVNGSALALASSIERRHDLRLRVALGATPTQVAIVPFTETAVVTGLGGTLGILLAPGLLDAVLTLAPIALPTYLQPSLSGWALAASAGLCVAAAISGAILPAFTVWRRAGALGTRGPTALHDRSRGIGGYGALVVGQVGLTTSVVALAALLARSYQAVTAVPLGFRDDVVRLAVTVSPAENTDPVALRARLTEAARSLSSTVATGFAWPTLPPWDANRASFTHQRFGDLPDERAPSLGAHGVDPDLLALLGIPMLAGRGIEPTDADTTVPVVVISDAIARRLGGRDQAIGTQLLITGSDPLVPARATIVGVAGDVAWDGLGEHGTGRMIGWHDPGDERSSRFDAYYPIAQTPRATRLLSMAVAVRGDPAAAIGPLTRAVSAAAPHSAVHWTGTMAEELAAEYQTARFALFLTLGFATGALVLAAIGLFALVTHTVSRRIPEFAVRLALGASPALVRRGVLGAGLRLVLLGCLVGAVGATVAGQAVRRLLYATAPSDPVAAAATAGVLLVVGFLACWHPARRASSVAPMAVLRRE